MSVTALLLCAGRGERLGADVPKAMVPLAGRPLFTWSLAALQACDAVDAIVVVGAARTLQELLAAAGLPGTKIAAWVEGGAERQHSVARGLGAVPAGTTLVAVHDCARALVTPGVIARAVDAARAHGAALAAVPLADTLKQVADGAVTGTPPRAGLWRAQTPQVFRRDWLEAAHAAAPGVATDDAALVESLGHTVHVAEGDALNFKITTPGDLALAGRWLAAAPRAPEDGMSGTLRIGMGYDVHPVAAGRPLVLGGVRFASDWGLAGHSDADVLAHAIGDALLGAAGAGDLGTHFPPGDPAWKDASSLVILQRIRALLDARGAAIVNVDAMLVAEAPKIAPHRDAMRAALAGALGIAADRVSVKATTHEGLGAFGRREGLAASAVALVDLAR